jgi:hypothetical protein
MLIGVSDFDTPHAFFALFMDLDDAAASKLSTRTIDWCCGSSFEAT